MARLELDVSDDTIKTARQLAHELEIPTISQLFTWMVEDQYFQLGGIPPKAAREGTSVEAAVKAVLEPDVREATLTLAAPAPVEEPDWDTTHFDSLVNIATSDPVLMVMVPDDQLRKKAVIQVYKRLPPESWGTNEARALITRTAALLSPKKPGG